jgi:hypothetical protein
MKSRKNSRYVHVGRGLKVASAWPEGNGKGSIGFRIDDADQAVRVAMAIMECCNRYGGFQVTVFKRRDKNGFGAVVSSTKTVRQLEEEETR